MAKAKKCDRCGKLYEYNSPEHIITINYGFIYSYEAILTNYDLCKECATALGDWLEAPTSQVINAHPYDKIVSPLCTLTKEQTEIVPLVEDITIPGPTEEWEDKTDRRCYGQFDSNSLLCSNCLKKVLCSPVTARRHIKKQSEER